MVIQVSKRISTNKRCLRHTKANLQDNVIILIGRIRQPIFLEFEKYKIYDNFVFHGVN